MKRDFHNILGLLARWAVISASLSLLLFAAAGTTRIASLRAYLVVCSAMLLITMLAVDLRLARERASPGPDAIAEHLRLAAGFLHLLTLAVASFAEARTLTPIAVPSSVRLAALIVFVVTSSLQAWAMAANPFFSPVVRIQNESGHRLIDSGPYRFVRHPGYLAMCISVVASAIAIGSFLALIPASAFVFVIQRRARLEDEFLRLNLCGYVAYAERVGAGLPFIRSS